MAKSLGTILFLLLFVFGVYFYISRPELSYVEEAPPSNISDSIDIKMPREESPLLESKTKKEHVAKEMYSLNVEYPAVVLATDPTLARVASDVIKGEVDRMIQAFQEEAREMAKNEKLPEGSASDLTIRYQATLLSPTLISIKFDRSAYLRGAAHPDSGSSVLLFDLVDRALLETSDLFTPGHDYLDFLSSYSREKLRETFKDLSNQEFEQFVILGTEPKQENFKEVSVDLRGINIIFNPYQVAPYARGTVIVTLPFEEVRDKLTSRVREAIESANLPGQENQISEPSIILAD